MITTERLVLRPVSVDDIDRLLEFTNLQEVVRWLGRAERSRDGLVTEIAEAAADPDDHRMVVLLDDLVIGTVTLEVEDGWGQPGMPRRTLGSFGYVLDPAHAGRGYATEAARAVLAHAFGSLGVRRLTAGAFADNLASVRVLEKVGMRREQLGVQDSWHRELGWIDGVTYALLADEWRAVRH